MASPDAFGFGPECQKDFPYQSFSHFVLVSRVVCVSCRKIISIALFCNCSKRSNLLLSFCSPFMFRVKRYNCLFSVLSVLFCVRHRQSSADVVMCMSVYVLLLLFLFLCFSCSILNSIVCNII